MDTASRVALFEKYVNEPAHALPSPPEPQLIVDARTLCDIKYRLGNLYTTFEGVYLSPDLGADYLRYFYACYGEHAERILVQEVAVTERARLLERLLVDAVTKQRQYPTLITPRDTPAGYAYLQALSAAAVKLCNAELLSLRPLECFGLESGDYNQLAYGVYTLCGYREAVRRFHDLLSPHVFFFERPDFMAVRHPLAALFEVLESEHNPNGCLPRGEHLEFFPVICYSVGGCCVSRYSQGAFDFDAPQNFAQEKLLAAQPWPSRNLDISLWYFEPTGKERELKNIIRALYADPQGSCMAQFSKIEHGLDTPTATAVAFLDMPECCFGARSYAEYVNKLESLDFTQDILVHRMRLAFLPHLDQYKDLDVLVLRRMLDNWPFAKVCDYGAPVDIYKWFAVYVRLFVLASYLRYPLILEVARAVHGAIPIPVHEVARLIPHDFKERRTTQHNMINFELDLFDEFWESRLHLALALCYLYGVETATDVAGCLGAESYNSYYE